MKVSEKINTEESIIGEDIITWIYSNKAEKTPEEQCISSKLYHKYIACNGTKIYKDIYYYIKCKIGENGANIAYIVRDNIKSPRALPDNIANIDLFQDGVSFRGNLIKEWAYHHNSINSDKATDAQEIIKTYIQSQYPIKNKVYYKLKKGKDNSINIFRDIERSPRKEPTE